MFCNGSRGSFTFELLPYKERMSRHRELVVCYQPVCNRKTQMARS